MVDQKPKDKLPGTKKSVIITIIIFMLIAQFNPEILTGSTNAITYFSVIVIIGLLFYGLHAAIIADIAARYRLGWRTIYLLGLIYGILEEGLTDMTMTRTTGPGTGFPLRILGLNLTWVPYIMIFHAVISILCTILIIRLIWPERVNKPFLNKKHYAIILFLLAITYIVIIGLVVNIYGPPPAIAILILIALCLVLLYFAKVSESTKIASEDVQPRKYIYRAVLFSLITFLLPNLLQTITSLEAPLTVFMVVMAYAFWRFFAMMDADKNLTKNRMLNIFSSLILFWLIFGLILRTPFSSIVAIIGVGLQLYLGWQATKKS